MSTTRLMRDKLVCPMLQKEEIQLKQEKQNKEKIEKQTSIQKQSQTEKQSSSKRFSIADLSYEERLAGYQQEVNDYRRGRDERKKQGGTPLYEHIRQFLDETAHHCPATVTKELKEMYASGALFKGPIISEFNSHHSGSNGPIKPGMDFSEHIHYGTTRIFNADGTFNQAYWNDLVKFAEDRQGRNETDILRQSTVEDEVKYINNRDGYEPNTGRRFTLASLIQVAAGAGARAQLFDLLSCGYKPKKDWSTANAANFEDTVRKLFNDFVTDPNWIKDPNYETIKTDIAKYTAFMVSKNDKCIKMDDLKLFFQDAPEALLKAKWRFLPINEKIPDHAPKQELQQQELQQRDLQQHDLQKDAQENVDVRPALRM